MALTVYGSPYVDGTDLIANYPAASLTVAQSIDSAGYYIGRGNNTQTGSYTTVLTDAGKVITMSNASANTVTIPANSSVAYVIGTRINILNLGAGACTPTAGAGVTINGTITALATNSSAAVIKTATNTWSYVPFGSGTPTLTSGDVSSTTGSPTITTSGGFTIYAFTGSGSITLSKAGLCTVLILGGGAGGGAYFASGGGAGGHLPITDAFLASGSNTVTVGAGGAGGTTSGVGYGGLASILGSYYALGGGGGASTYDGTNASKEKGQPGGSGGGGASNFTPGFAGGAGTSGQGSAGGTGTTTTDGAGGGGAGGVGANGGAGGLGVGGAGLANSITGSSVTRGGGGGGGSSATAAAGGSGGGGAGSAANPGTGTAGGVNLGGGGGGGGNTGTTGVGGAGGSGIVIVRVVT